MSDPSSTPPPATNADAMAALIAAALTGARCMSMAAAFRQAAGDALRAPYRSMESGADAVAAFAATFEALAKACDAYDALARTVYCHPECAATAASYQARKAWEAPRPTKLVCSSCTRPWGVCQCGSPPLSWPVDNYGYADDAPDAPAPQPEPKDPTP